MKRFLTLAMTAAVLLGPAATAFARGDGWQPLPANPFDATLCGANLHFEFPNNREYFRIVHIGGQDVFQFNGHFEAVITNVDTGQSVTENASGPGFNPLANAEFNARGQNLVLLSPEDAARNGVPELFVSSGFIDIVFDESGAATIVRFNGTFVDLCPLLT
jgi:hypothetical protein